MCRITHLFLPHSKSKSLTRPLPPSPIECGLYIAKIHGIKNNFFLGGGGRGKIGELNKGKTDNIELLGVKKVNVSTILLPIVAIKSRIS